MFRTFFWKIWLLGIFCSVFAICLVLFGLVNYYVKAEEKEMLQRNFLLAQIISHEVESGYLRGLWPYKTLKMVSDDENVLLLWVAKPNGEVFWANEAEMLGRTVQDPFLGLDEVKNRNSFFRGEKVKLIAHPMKIELKEKPWTLFLGVSFRQLRKTQRDIVSLSVVFLVLSAGFVSAVSFYLSKGIARPLGKLREGVEIIGRGNLDHRIEIKTGDEFGGLGKAFNQMAEELKRAQAVCSETREILEIRVRARTRELQELAGRLEETVEERTKELRRRIEELERFHRLTVGRELKMMELKKELRGLKGRPRKAEKSIKGLEEERSLAGHTPFKEPPKKDKGPSKKPPNG